MAKVQFHSNSENFYNETMETLIAKKLQKLEKFKFKEFVFNHKVRSNGGHKVKLIVGDLVATKEDANFETALIEVIQNIKEMHLKEKDYLTKKRHQNKKYQKKLEAEVLEEDCEEEEDV